MSRYRHPATVILVSLLVQLVAPRAWAQHGSNDKLYLLAGAPVGVSTAKGLVLGGEVSLACWQCFRAVDLAWAGGYVDGVRDFGTDSTRFSVGPELGVGILGLDGGLLLDVDADGQRFGWVARVLVTFGVVGVYGRAAKVPGTSTLGEFGLLFKAFWRL